MWNNGLISIQPRRGDGMPCPPQRGLPSIAMVINNMNTIAPLFVGEGQVPPVALWTHAHHLSLVIRGHRRASTCQLALCCKDSP